MITSPSTTRPRLREERDTIAVTYGQERLEGEVFLELIHILSGEFVMGSPEDEEGRRPSEGPQRNVSVPAFWMGQYPVTQQEWRIVSGYDKVERDLDPDPSRFKGDRRPVEQVSWYEAKEFCDRLSKHTGRTYRLPTEAEWEYACRGGTTSPFHFGPTLSAKYSNYRAEDVYGPGELGEYRRETVDVDHFKVANDFGLCDMHGNVLEWCQDHWHDNYEGAPTDGSAWQEDPLHNNRRVLRGGSWIRPSEALSVCLSRPLHSRLSEHQSWFSGRPRPPMTPFAFSFFAFLPFCLGENRDLKILFCFSRK